MFKLFKNKEAEYNYFEEFTTIASLTVDVSNIISLNLKNYSLNSLTEPIQEILEIDRKANKVSKELISYLYEDFLPPIERQDIINLSHSLNMILENTKNLIISLDIYQVEAITPSTLKMMELTLNENKRIPKIIENLENFKHPKQLLIEIEEVRVSINNMQTLQSQMIKQLYLEESETIQLIKYTKVYEKFEKIHDSMKRLMNSVEAIIIQNT